LAGSEGLGAGYRQPRLLKGNPRQVDIAE
jgi:hypothetical protein